MEVILTIFSKFDKLTILSKPVIKLVYQSQKSAKINLTWSSLK